MGQIKKNFYERLIPSEPDRNPNRIICFLTEYPGIVGVNFRNMKWQLYPDIIPEWKEGFAKAVEKFKAQDKLKYDI